MKNPTTILTSRRAIWAGLALIPATAALVTLGVALSLFWAARIPEESPLARMYRTEADLALLVRAVESYHAHHGAYPPFGPPGLALAAEHLSRNHDYLPDGPPPDGWDRPYVYVPHTSYEAPNAPVYDGAGGVGTFQVYSAGADGDPGLTNPSARADNITSWERGRPWRAVYRELQTTHGRDRDAR